MIDLLNQTSPRFRAGLLVFVAGLIVIGLLSVWGLWRTARSGPVSEDGARRILRNSAGPLLIQLVLRGMDLAFAKVLYSLLAQEVNAVGEYELAVLLVGLILTTIADWGLTVWLTREIAAEPHALKRLFGTTLLVRWGLALIALPLAGLVIWSYAQLHAVGIVSAPLSGRGSVLIGILTLTLLPSGLAAATTAVFLAHEQTTTPALANLFNNSLSTLLRIALLVLGFGVIGIAWGALIATVVNAAVFAWLLVRRFGWLGVGWDGQLARKMLANSFPLMLNALLVAVFFRFDQFIIQGAPNGGPLAVAQYGAAYKFVGLALVLPPIVINALFPSFARQALHDRVALLRGYRFTLRLLLLLALPIAITLSVLAPTAIALLSDQVYVAASAPALAILIWFVPFSYVNGIAQYVLIALGRQSTITGAFVATAGFNLVANLIAVPIWGINAAAAITVCSELVLYLPFAWVLKRELGAAPLWSVAWRPCLAGAGAAVSMWLLRGWPSLAVLIGGGVYGLGLWGLRTFTADDRRLWQRLRRPTPADQQPAETS